MAGDFSSDFNTDFSGGINPPTQIRPGSKPLYKPPTAVQTIQMPFLAIVQRADPGWARWKHREIEYEFTRREFWADPYTSGPYNPIFDNPVFGEQLVTDTGLTITDDNGNPIVVNP
jgi:hypothetical protein